MNKLRYISILLLLLVFLTACGGGNSDGLPDIEAAKISLGEDQNVDEQKTVVIDAAFSPIGGTFSWNYRGDTVLEDFTNTGEQATFTAPTVTEQQIFTFTVDYISLDDKKATDSIKITINPINNRPQAIVELQSPISEVVASRVEVILDASKSFDDDGLIAAYFWQQVSGSPSIEPIDESNNQTFNFISPEVNTITDFTFKLTVTDNEQAIDEKEITITVDPTIITHQVRAGIDQAVNEEQQVSLSAEGTPSGGLYFWTSTSGSLNSIFPSNEKVVTFSIPATKVNTNHNFTVEYQAPDGVVVTDTVQISVTAINKHPIAVIQITTPEALPAKFGEIVTLDPNSSYDPDTDGMITSYEWQLLGGEVNYTVNNNNELIFIAPSNVNSISYIFQLTVTDDESGTNLVTQEIKVTGTEDSYIANAGYDQIVEELTEVNIDGSQSIVANNTSLVCKWLQIPNAAPTVVLSDYNSCQSTFISPDIDVPTDVIFELTVNDASIDTLTITVMPRLIGVINDTGITKCYSNSLIIDCDDAIYPSQDAEFGRDSIATIIDKTGASQFNTIDSFDYTKLDSNGGELSNDTAITPSCIRDNVTGLIWQIKENSTTAEYKYTWFYPDGSTGGNDGVVGNANGTCPSTTDCGLETYVQEVNAKVYCGATNWRVPNFLELQSLVNFGLSSTDGVIDLWAFNDLPLSNSPTTLYFWSSETSASGGGHATSWVINFLTGNDNSLPKSTPAYVRLVRNP